ncbi:MAG: CRISPR-associated endonuclease Cas2 [Candidatus Aenigmatarchaeota archaeon]
MYVIIVYDVSVERVNKVCQFLRQYLNWIQNSVFEGELSESELKRVEIGLNEIINPDEDSIIIYQFPTERILKKIHIGIRKAEPSVVI